MKLFFKSSSSRLYHTSLIQVSWSSLVGARMLPPLVKVFSPRAIQVVHFSLILALKVVFQLTSGAWIMPVQPPGMTVNIQLLYADLAVSLIWLRKFSHTRKRSLKVRVPRTSFNHTTVVRSWFIHPLTDITTFNPLKDSIRGSRRFPVDKNNFICGERTFII